MSRKRVRFPVLYMLASLLSSAFAFSMPGFASEPEPLLLRQFEHRTWGAREGAPLNVLHLVEDRLGVIWLTSPSGLYTFNGINFAPFPMPKGVDVLYTLATGPSGNIWSASRTRGLVRIDPSHRITVYGTAQGLPAHTVTSTYEDLHGEVWSIVDRNLYHLVHEHWYNETSKLGLPAGQAVDILMDRRGALWVATTTSLFVLPDKQQRFVATAEDWHFDDILTLFEGRRGDLWVEYARSGNETVVKQVGAAGQSKWFNESIILPNYYKDACFDSAGTLWVSGHGIYRVTFLPGGSSGQADRKTEPYQLEHIGVADGLSSDSTRWLLNDDQGDVWTSTMHGLDRFRTPVLVKAALPILDASTLPDLAPGNAGQVWLGANDRPLYSAIGDATTAEGKPLAGGIVALFQDRQGGLWFPDREGLVHREGAKTEELNYPVVAGIRQFVQLADGSVLALFYNGGVWRRFDGRWEKTPLGSSLGEFPIVLFVDSHQELWVGYPSGTVTRSNGVQEQKVISKVNDLGGISAFYETSTGILAAGQGGIAVLIDGQLRRLHFADELLAEFVTGIVQSDDGDFWLNGRHGVARYAAAEFQRGIASKGEYSMTGRLYTEDDLKGPTPVFYDLPSAAKDRTGRLWFNTAVSLVYVDPAHLRSSPAAPKLAVVALLSDGIPLTAGADIPSGPHTVRIQYFGSNLTAPEEVRYRYRLSKVDSAWQDVAERTEAVYTRLRPGDYTFEVSAKSADNVWTAPVPFHFNVQPTFFQRPIFLVLCGICLFILVLLAYRLRVGFVVRSLEARSKARLDERVRIARELHDTLLQGVQGLMLTVHVATQKVDEESRARPMLESALRKADVVLVEARDRVTELRSENIRSTTLLDAVSSVGGALNENGRTAFEVTASSQLLELRPIVKEEIFWIAREAITNAFLHSDAKFIRVHLDYKDDRFSMLVSDDGRGLPPATLSDEAPTNHYGIVGMKERARKIKGVFLSESSPAQGTSISVSVPASSAYSHRESFVSKVAYYFGAEHSRDS